VEARQRGNDLIKGNHPQGYVCCQLSNRRRRLFSSGAAKRRSWIDNTPEAVCAPGEPLAASRSKGAAELARLRPNHPEGGISVVNLSSTGLYIHISVYMGATSGGGGPPQLFFDFALETPATGSLCQESR